MLGGKVVVDIKTYSFAFGPSFIYSSKSIFYTFIHLRVLLEKKSGECNRCSTIFGLAVSGGREWGRVVDEGEGAYNELYRIGYLYWFRTERWDSPTRMSIITIPKNYPHTYFPHSNSPPDYLVFFLHLAYHSLIRSIPPPIPMHTKNFLLPKHDVVVQENYFKWSSEATTHWFHF